MQPQRHKAEVLDMGTKDYILTDLTMEEKKIMMIDGEEVLLGTKNKLLPIALISPRFWIYPVHCLVCEYMVDFKIIQTLSEKYSVTSFIFDITENIIFD